MFNSRDRVDDYPEPTRKEIERHILNETIGYEWFSHNMRWHWPVGKKVPPEKEALHEEREKKIRELEAEYKRRFGKKWKPGVSVL